MKNKLVAMPGIERLEGYKKEIEDTSILGFCYQYCRKYGKHCDLIVRGYTSDESGRRSLFQDVVIYDGGVFKWAHDYPGRHETVITECIAVEQVAF